jgi:hypothetical protein
MLCSVPSSVLESQPNIGDAIKDIQANIKTMNLVLLPLNTRMDTVEGFHRPSQLTAEPVDSNGESMEQIATHEKETSKDDQGNDEAGRDLPPIPPHRYITDDDLTSDLERHISEAFHYSFIIAPEYDDNIQPSDILRDTLSLEQRAQFAKISQSFVFKALQILRERKVHVCRTSNARSNLFHLLTGQDCICNNSSSDSDISIRQHAEDSNKLQKRRIIHRDEPSDS